MHRLRRLRLDSTCPECFRPQLLGGVCQHCGFEPAIPRVPPEPSRDSHSPTNLIHPGNSLGSELDYRSVGFANNGTVVKRWIERTLEDPLVLSVKSDVMEELKRWYPDERVTNLAGRLCLKDVAEFRASYPLLTTSKNLRRQLAANVIARLSLVYPFLRQPHPEEVTLLHE